MNAGHVNIVAHVLLHRNVKRGGVCDRLCFVSSGVRFLYNHLSLQQHSCIFAADALQLIICSLPLLRAPAFRSQQVLQTRFCVDVGCVSNPR